MKLHKRYVTKEAVKKAMKIDSFRNLSVDKVVQFASMIPYVDKEVALAIIDQFPAYVEFTKICIDRYSETCDSILKSNNESHNAVIRGYQTILDALSNRLASENLSYEEKNEITEQMILVADKIAEADIKNKKFLERVATKTRIFLGLGFLAVGAAIGISSNLGYSSDLPEIPDGI